MWKSKCVLAVRETDDAKLVERIDEAIKTMDDCAKWTEVAELLHESTLKAKFALGVLWSERLGSN